MKLFFQGRLTDGKFRAKDPHRDHSWVGKVVYPFATNEEGALGMAELELKGSLRGAILKKGFACKGSEVNNIDAKLDAWDFVKQLGAGIQYPRPLP